MEWFKSYLSQRQLRVKCLAGSNNETSISDHYGVDIGTPQGSCLGPLIFLIYNNDLHRHLSFCQCILFADDTTIFYSHTNFTYLEWCIQQDLQSLADWFRANRLTLNLDKSVYMLFSKNKQHNTKGNIAFDNVSIPDVQSTKFLGVIIDEDLNWNDHYKNILLKIKRNLNSIRNSRKFVNRNTAKLIYYGHIYSHISYCISVWGNMLQTSMLNKLQKIQDKCINLVDESRAQTVQKYKNNRILQIKEILLLENCKNGYKLINYYP